MRDIDWYLRVYDGYLSKEECDAYIDMYEQITQNESQRVRDLSVCYNKAGQNLCGDCSCLRINPMEYDCFQELNHIFTSQLYSVLQRYYEDCELHKVQWPEEFGFEELRIKRFKVDPEGQESHGYHGLGNHVDVYSHAHAKRFLGMICYLNDDFDGGETYFNLLKQSIEPKAGRIFLFPPDWTLSHRGIPPRQPSNRMAKYFLMTYVNYIDMTKVNDGIDFSHREVAQPDFGWTPHHA